MDPNSRPFRKVAGGLPIELFLALLLGSTVVGQDTCVGGEALNTNEAARAASPELGLLQGGATRTVSLGNVEAISGAPCIIPVLLRAYGGENAIGLSLNYQRSSLEFIGASAGNLPLGLTITVNNLAADSGRIGILLGVGFGQRIPAGTWDILFLDFKVAVGATGSAAISFGDDPIVREVVDAEARTLPAEFLGGTISFHAPGEPRLDLSFSGSSLRLLWPLTATNFQLESSSSLTLPAWMKLDTVPGQTNGKWFVDLVLTNDTHFFRLRQPAN